MRLRSKVKGKNIDSDDSTDSGDARRSLLYQESNDSSSRITSEDPSGSIVPESQAPVTTHHFTGETDYTYVTQDKDHGARQSPKTSMGKAALLRYILFRVRQ